MKLCLACALSVATTVLLSFSPAHATDTDGPSFVFEGPKGVTPNQVFALLTPYEERSLVTLIGLQKWPHRENTYVGIVCLEPDKERFDQDSKYKNGKSFCEAGTGMFSDATNPVRVFIGVMEYTDHLKVVASSGGPLDVLTKWQRSNIVPDDDDAKKDGAYPGLYKGFDFAPYKVSKDQVAFGLRVAWTVGYAGGGGLYEALMLFLVQGDKIVNILSEPMAEWGEAGSDDDKRVWETVNVLRILPQKHAGYFDLQLKQRDKKWKKAFQWDAGANRYRPVSK